MSTIVIREADYNPLEGDEPQMIFDLIKESLSKHKTPELYIGLHEDGDYSLEQLQEKIDNKEKIISFRLSYFISDEFYHRYTIGVETFKDEENGEIKTAYVVSELEHFGIVNSFETPEEAVNSLFEDFVELEKKELSSNKINTKYKIGALNCS